MTSQKNDKSGRDAAQFRRDYDAFKATVTDSDMSAKLKKQEDSMRKALEGQIDKPYSSAELRKAIDAKQERVIAKCKEKARQCWDEVKAIRKKFLNDSIAGYQDAVALMNELFKYILAIAEALYYSMTAAYVEPWLEENLGLHKLSSILSSTGHDLKMAFKSAVGSPELHPTVSYDFNIDDKTGQVTTKFSMNHRDSNTERQDDLKDTDKNVNDFFDHDPKGQEFKHLFTTGFETGLEVWLHKHGYKNVAKNDQDGKKEPPRFVSASDGKPLTKDAFDALDKKDSFAEFMSGYSQLEVRPSFSP